MATADRPPMERPQTTTRRFAENVAFRKQEPCWKRVGKTVGNAIGCLRRLCKNRRGQSGLRPVDEEEVALLHQEELQRAVSSSLGSSWSSFDEYEDRMVCNDLYTRRTAPHTMHFSYMDIPRGGLADDYYFPGNSDASSGEVSEAGLFIPRVPMYEGSGWTEEQQENSALLFASNDQACLARFQRHWEGLYEDPIDQSLFADFDFDFEHDRSPQKPVEWDQFGMVLPRKAGPGRPAKSKGVLQEASNHLAFEEWHGNIDADSYPYIDAELAFYQREFERTSGGEVEELFHQYFRAVYPPFRYCDRPSLYSDAFSHRSSCEDQQVEKEVAVKSPRGSLARDITSVWVKGEYFGFFAG